MADKTLLIGDIGGTNARFALAHSQQPGFHDPITLKCADFASADDAIRHYLDEASAESPEVICLAVAGPIIENTVQVTNNHWTLNVAEIAADFAIDAVQLLNEEMDYKLKQMLYCSTLSSSLLTNSSAMY